MKQFSAGVPLFYFPSDLCCPFRVLPSGGGRVSLVRIFDAAAQARPIVTEHAPVPGGRLRVDWHSRGAHRQCPGSRFALPPFVPEAAATEHRVALHHASHVAFAPVTIEPRFPTHKGPRSRVMRLPAISRRSTRPRAAHGYVEFRRVEG